jgi:hypothetical protein
VLQDAEFLLTTVLRTRRNPSAAVPSLPTLNQRFIAKNDLAGRLRSRCKWAVSPPGPYANSDGTIWALGFDMDIRDSPDADKNVLAL